MSINFKDVSLLCEKCQQYGYCIAADERKKPVKLVKKSKLQKFNKIIPLSEREISHWVTLRTSIKDANSLFGKKLQQAHDLFHQQEFEQASYVYQDILETRNDCDEVRIGLAAAFYFLGKYEEGGIIAYRQNEKSYSTIADKFIRQCEKKLAEQITINKKPSIKKTSTNALRINNTSVHQVNN